MPLHSVLSTVICCCYYCCAIDILFYCTCSNDTPAVFSYTGQGVPLTASDIIYHYVGKVQSYYKNRMYSQQLFDVLEGLL